MISSLGIPVRSWKISILSSGARLPVLEAVLKLKRDNGLTADDIEGN
jgi:hypothetical protein